MREIKFRAWNNNTNFMLYGLSDIAAELTNNRDEYEVMQFTGLKDKNGKEIYEGDVVKYISNGQGEQLARVRWFHGGFHTEIIGRENPSLHSLGRADGYEIIGNIWENPELLTN